MEERLFWVGLGMGFYAALVRISLKRESWKTRLWAGVWHSMFWAGTGFALVMIITMSLDSRGNIPMQSISALNHRSLLYGCVAAAAGAVWGFFRIYAQGAELEERETMLSNDLEWADTFFSAVLLASFLMYFVLQAFKIPSGSMRATLLEGDHLFVNKFIYGIRIPMTSTRLARWKKVERGDVVVFRFPTDDTEEVHCGNKQYGKDFIKRAIGLPGDKVEVKNGVVFVNDKPLLHEAYTQTVDAQRQPSSPVRLDPDRYQNLWQDHQLDQTLGDATRDFFGPVKLPADEYFVMGDNGDLSCDSRFWGPVADRFLKGKAWFIYWPPDRIKGVE